MYLLDFKCSVIGTLIQGHLCFFPPPRFTVLLLTVFNRQEYALQLWSDCLDSLKYLTELLKGVL